MSEALGQPYLSQHRVTYNGVVLLDFGSLLKDAIAPDISEERETQVTGFVQGASVKGYDRGNRKGNCTFTLIREWATVWEAMADEINFLQAIPAGGGDTLIQISNIAGQTIIPNSVIGVTVAKNLGVRFSVFTITIVGGQLTGATLVANTIISEGGAVIEDESGSPVIGD